MDGREMMERFKEKAYKFGVLQSTRIINEMENAEAKSALSLHVRRFLHEAYQPYLPTLSDRPLLYNQQHLFRQRKKDVYT